MLTRIWSMLRSVTTRQAVGTDKAGNLYYRIASRDGPERRWVEYKDKSSADPTTLPVEWTSWLHGRRRDPPTAEEIIELEQKRKLVKFKAFLLQKEEEKRKFRAKSLQSGLTSDDVNPETMEHYLQKVATADSAGPPEAGEKDSEQANDVAEGTGPLRSPLDSGPFQPESWQPGVWQPDSSKQKVANFPPSLLTGKASSGYEVDFPSRKRQDVASCKRVEFGASMRPAWVLEKNSRKVACGSAFAPPLNTLQAGSNGRRGLAKCHRTAVRDVPLDRRMRNTLPPLHHQVTMAPLDLKVPTAFKLNNARYIPAVGLGTWQSKPGEVGAAVKAAIEAGYRHIDCAAAYKNQREVGDALHSAFQSGLVKREDLWITTKLWNSEHHEVSEALERCLKDLQLDYIDLYLIHWPLHFRTGASMPPKVEDFAPLDIKSTWQAMEKLVDSGKVRSIGVSNFSAKKVNDLLSYAKIPPAVDQVECHPLWQQRKLQDTLAAHDIHLTAYSPIGSSGTTYVKTSVLNQPVIKELADKHQKSLAQIALRWGLQRGHSVIPKSTNKERLKSNLDIFDFSLSDEDMRKIGEIEQERLIKGEEFLNDSTSPYKTQEELWDGEV